MMELALSIAILCCGPDPAADAVVSGRAVLAKGGYPWYDARRDDFKYIRPYDDQPRLLDSFLHRLIQRIGKYDFLSRFGPVAQVAGYCMLAVAIAALIYLLMAHWNAILDYFRRSMRQTKAVPAQPRFEELPEGVPAIDDLLGEALRLQRIGNLRFASVHLFAHALMTLSQRGVLRLARGKTNRAYQSEAAEVFPPIAGRFDELVAMFEDAFYGRLEITPERFQSNLDSVRGFESLQPQGGR